MLHLGNREAVTTVRATTTGLGTTAAKAKPHGPGRAVEATMATVLLVVLLVVGTVLLELLLGNSKPRLHRLLQARLGTDMADTRVSLLEWLLLVLREWVFLLHLVCLLCTALRRRPLHPRTVLRLR